MDPNASTSTGPSSAWPDEPPVPRFEKGGPGRICGGAPTPAPEIPLDPPFPKGEAGDELPVSTVSVKRGNPPPKNAAGQFTGRRAKKPKLLAVITEACTGCAGAPVCQIYCPVDECMLLVPAGDVTAYGRVWVDPLKCVGCQKCVSRGPAQTFLDGCPWDAIVMVSTAEWEAANGTLAY